MFHGDEVVRWFVLSELELTAKEMVIWKAAINRVTGYDGTQREPAALLERSVKISEENSAIPKPALRRSKIRKE